MKIIVKHKNRRLYDLENSRRITAKELVRLPFGSFKVVHHQTKRDITIDVLRASLTGKVSEFDKRAVTHYLASIIEGV